jgi:hypothetical protein
MIWLVYANCLESRSRYIRAARNPPSGHIRTAGADRLARCLPESSQRKAPGFPPRASSQFGRHADALRENARSPTARPEGPAHA